MQHIRHVLIDFNGVLCLERYFALAPEGVEDWHGLLDRVVFSPDLPLFDQWMAGERTLEDIAQILSPYVGVEPPELVEIMLEGCRNLSLNQTVVDFARDQKRQGRNLALVTGNMDVLRRAVVPSLGLDGMFDVIVSSSDCGELRKDRLCEMALEQLGHPGDLQASLLIDDSPSNIQNFKALGGHGCLYQNERSITEWLDSNVVGSLP